MLSQKLTQLAVFVWTRWGLLDWRLTRLSMGVRMLGVRMLMATMLVTMFARTMLV